MPCPQYLFNIVSDVSVLETHLWHYSEFVAVRDAEIRTHVGRVREHNVEHIHHYMPGVTAYASQISLYLQPTRPQQGVSRNAHDESRENRGLI